MFLNVLYEQRVYSFLNRVRKMYTTNMKHLPILLLFFNRFLAQFICPVCHMACIIGGLEVVFFFKIVKNIDRKIA